MIKLHLGCGDKKLSGFINVDIREEVNPDIVDDIATLSKLKEYEGKVELIYACHVLEHFKRNEYMKVLRRWYDILAVGGVLRIAVPDFLKVVTQYRTGSTPLSQLKGFLYGGQDYPENFHYMAWDTFTLAEDLEKAGFRMAYSYDWRRTEHAAVDDYSQAYLPHMDKENGVLMSLNMEAVK